MNCCDCCGRNISKLKPFGKEGDPLAGNFEGSILIKKFRSAAPKVKNEKWNRIIENYTETYGRNYDKFEKDMILLFGKEEFERLYMWEQANGTIGASWECRDCICLDDDEYFEVIKTK